MAKNNGTAGKASVLSDWLGYWVFITYTAGPNVDADEPTKPVRDQPEAVTASFLLENYGDLGLEVKRNPNDPTIFMSWGAVMYIQGPPPDVRTQIDQAQQAQGSKGQ